MRKTKAHRIKIEPFRWETDDPLAAEHALVSRLVSEILKSDWQYYTELDLSLTKTGNQVLDAEPETAANIVLALVAHTSYFDSLAQKVKALANSEIERMNWHQAPEWEAIWYPRQVSAQALRRLVRRKLPLRSEHLIRLADWISSAESQSDSLYPL